MSKRKWDLKDYQKKREDCSFLEEKPSEGNWCNKNNCKCCLGNCPSPPFTSDGKQKLGYHKHKLQKKTKNQGFIKEATTKSRVYKGSKEKHKPIPGKTISPLKSKIRLHNDNIKLQINKVNFILEKPVKLKYTEYKLLRDKQKHIQIFKNGTLTVRFLRDIQGKSVDEAKKKADKRLYDFIRRFKVEGIHFIQENNHYTQLQRDYAILGTDLAKKYVKEKRKFFYFDRKDGKCRAEIDFSKKKPEYENPHPEKGYLDAKKSESLFNNLGNNHIKYFDNIYENNKWDLPTETKKKTDHNYDLIGKVIQAQDMMTKNQQIFDKNMASHLEVLNKIGIAVDNLRKEVKKINKK